ncbi:hypothetical protein EOI86_23825 [Hwanghaeella grinnelliae]|uniref:Uncharacterized protein n=1 Tax=Hwanghaeella grinnelliae TaxID=2500179 RepID=A0A3S2Z598_9PROT|nr:hypothetical protein [Hwanghaeella grinnelliae]RVU34143.1 hypothetical protein EOI86_23825 [Hwanghaeella grinnelliae]
MADLSGCFLFRGLGPMLKTFLYGLAACLFVGPIAVWIYFVELACAYQTSNADCGFQLANFLDSEFFVLAALPWILAGFCAFLGFKRR